MSSRRSRRGHLHHGMDEDVVQFLAQVPFRQQIVQSHLGGGGHAHAEFGSAVEEQRQAPLLHGVEARQVGDEHQAALGLGQDLRGLVGQGGGHVHPQEGTVGGGEVAGGVFLAAAGFPQQHHGQPRGHGQVQALGQAANGFPGPQGGKVARGGGLGRLRIQGFLHRLQQLLVGDGLFQVVEGPQAGGLHGGVHGAVA